MYAMRLIMYVQPCLIRHLLVACYLCTCSFALYARMTAIPVDLIQFLLDNVSQGRGGQLRKAKSLS